MADVTEPFLEVKGLSRIYSMGDVKVRALHNVTFDIKRGEFAIENSHRKLTLFSRQF